ncbi:hypothetical protein [Aureibacter tunicatorum]|uniref:Bacterial surface antigen (D15) domain-containing protein n=1 Tax=Aureibacter tunicatorum TaxID=866807 RepID=A0AAE3XNG5_9BACT|nr:hypothetical protein [Aureibacter tunicatorum]MDR6239115.1 hypothetical protein [Aureibacter tunicatorum]
MKIITRPDTLTGMKGNEGHFIITPAFSYAPETGLEYGISGLFTMKEQKQPKYLSFVNPYVSYTIRNQFTSEIRVNYYTQKYFSQNVLSFIYYPLYYYGIGNNTKAGDYEFYTSKQVYMQGRVMYAVEDDVYLGVRYKIQNNHLVHFTDTTKFYEDHLFGLSGGWNIGVGPILFYDTRDNAQYPSKGVALEMSWVDYFAVYHYSNFHFFLRNYFNVNNEKNVLAWALSFNMINGSAPFYEYNRLGGSNALRGYRDTRFIDRIMWFYEAEFRRSLFWKVKGVFFAGFGNVHPQLHDLTLYRTKVALGVGLRYKIFKDQKLHVGLDYAVGLDNGNGFYIRLGEAF